MIRRVLCARSRAVCCCSWRHIEGGCGGVCGGIAFDSFVEWEEDASPGNTGSKVGHAASKARWLAGNASDELQCRVHNLGNTNPSTSPLFLPRAAKSGNNSTPVKTPFLPCTPPTKRTIPSMFPGTSTVSPTDSSAPKEALALGVSGECAIVLVVEREREVFRVARA